jgi:membrane protein
MVNPVTWLYEKFNKLNDTVWNTPLSEISKGKTFLFKQLRIIFVAARGFSRDNISLRASALTFYSLLSVIPVAAIAFAIAKGFGLDQDLKQLIIDKFESEPMILNWLLENATGAIEKTRGGYMAGVGVVILFWAVMLLLSDIENSFNHIWQVRVARPWYRKFTDYLTIMIIAPIFLILSGAITGFIITTLPEYMSTAPILDFFKPVISFLFKFAPYILTWITLTILFIIMPNTKVKVIPAVISAVIAGTILQIIQWLYIDLQFGITKLNAIYGSFAAVPLFIIWLQTNWTVVLLGAEISFANQNVSRYDMESEALNISNYQKRTMILMIMQMVIRNFSIGEKPVSAEDLATNLKIPARLTLEILQDLTSANLLSVIHENEEKENLYQPAMDIHKLTISYVFSKLDKHGFDKIMVIKNHDYEKIVSMLDKFDSLIANSDANILIKDLHEFKNND